MHFPTLTLEVLDRGGSLTATTGRTPLMTPTTDHVWVADYYPTEGPAGETLRVLAAFVPAHITSVRLCVAGQPLHTELEEHANTWLDRTYLVSTTIPPFHAQVSRTVPLSIQVLHSAEIVAELPFGVYTYAPERGSEDPPSPPRPLDLPPTQTKQRIIAFLPPTISMCQGWGFDESNCRRRLVRFMVSQDRTHGLAVSCEALPQETYDMAVASAEATQGHRPDQVQKGHNHVIVSCIWREETKTFCITSVDLLRLLCVLYGEEMSCEEKNRVRRHLERFMPRAIGRRREGASFYNSVIATFPSPRPTTILKDIKVFNWHALEDALESIMYRRVRCFTLVCSSRTDDAH